MKKVSIFVTILVLIFIAASFYPNEKVDYNSRRSFGPSYRSDYSIRALLIDPYAVEWEPMNGRVHTSAPLSKEDAEAIFGDSDYEPVYEPEEVRIININGDKCTLLYSSGEPDFYRTFAKDVPLSALQYDEKKVEKARKKKNHFRMELYGLDRVTVINGDGSSKSYTFSEYDDDFTNRIYGVYNYSYNRFFFRELLTFVGINTLLYVIAFVLSSRKRSPTIPYVILIALNAILSIAPLLYLVMRLIRSVVT